MNRSRFCADLVVCTRDRPEDLLRCLRSVEPQVELLRQVIVVDGGVKNVAARAIRSLQASPIWLRRLAYEHAEFDGLPEQRNFGIRFSNAQVVHFLDDDVEVLPGYFDAIHEVYMTDLNEDVLGIGGIQVNVRAPVDSRQRQRLYRGSRPGAVMPSGFAVGLYVATGEVDVEWLPGCSMSYRASVFERHRFDEGLRGYANGEDIDFSYRVKQDGRLVITGNARLLHHRASSNRLSASQLVASEVGNRARRVASRTGDYDAAAFWGSLGVQFRGEIASLLRGHRSALRRIAGLVVGSWRARRALSGHTGASR